MALSAAGGTGPKPSMHFVFDGGAWPDGSGIRLQYEELDEYRFVDPGAVTSYLPPYLVPRVTGALRARATGAAVYSTVVTADPAPA